MCSNVEDFNNRNLFLTAKLFKQGYTRGDHKVRGKWLPFLNRLINRARITAHNTAIHMLLIDYNLLDVSCLRSLQLSSRQRYIARTGSFLRCIMTFYTTN